ncbi:hypothetical protein KPL71_011805 [Citrus sinensis]|uniref:Uncharacterized protein n=1 Tax=Citrus sinensis TaxID=2711 RepID=A0ACB8L659_CITSI|nr:hypothetical protein KPL71_011805 [Citrus sinensis]
MLQTVGQFNKLPSEDPHLHLKLFLEVSDAFKIAGASQEALRLRLFPFSLRDRARVGLNSLPPDSITTWNDLADKFLMKYFSPTKNAKLRNEITSFHQLKDESLLMVDASANGALLSKSYNEAYENLERIANNNYQWPSTRQVAAKGTTGVHNVDSLTAFSNRQNQDNPYSNTHNPGWRQHPNFSWSNQNQPVVAFSGQNKPAQPPGFYLQNQEKISINNDQLSSLEGLIKDYIVKNGAVVQSHIVSLRNLENQIGQLATALSNRPQGSLPNNTEDPRREWIEHCKVINLRSGKDVHSPVGHTGESSQAATFAKNDDPTPVENEVVAQTQTMTKEKHSAQPAAAQQFRHPPPFPQRFQKQQQDKQFSKILGVLKQLHINIPFVEVLEQMPNYAKFLKDILTKKKKRLGEFETIALTQESSRMLQSKIPQKMKDPGSFTIPCSIGTKYNSKTLCDLGASINLMPLSVFKQLGVGESRPTIVTLQLADRSHAYPEGKIKDVLVKMDKFIFSVDFIVLDFEADKEQVTFNVLDAMKSPDEIEDCNFISVVDFVVAERLHSCCCKEEINAVTFEGLDDENHGAANIAWSGEKQHFRIDDQIQQRELTTDQQEFKVNGPRVKHYLGADVNNLKRDRFLKDPG